MTGKNSSEKTEKSFGKNISCEAEIRKYCSIMTASGKFIIAYGVCILLKLLTYFYMYAKGDGDYQYETAVLAVLSFAAAVDMLLRVLIGGGAVRSGKGMKISGLYIVLVCVFFVYSIIDFTGYYIVVSDIIGLPGLIPWILMDAFSFVALIAVLYSAGKVKKLESAGTAKERIFDASEDECMTRKTGADDRK